MPDLETTAESCEVVGMARVIQHLRDPQNLIGYLLLSAWMKFMGVADKLPTISIG